MSKRRLPNIGVGFIDLLFILIFGLSVLLILRLQIKQADIKTKAEFVITVMWADGDPNDVDTWLQDPSGAIVCFRQKEKGLMHLDRDDLGHANDRIYINGQEIKYPYNQEITTIRGIIPGEWVLNVHMYKLNSGNPSKVSIWIDKLNPRVIRIFSKEIILATEWQEETVCRFIMDSNGDVKRWDSLPKKLI